MKKWIRQAGYFLVIMILLPYIITVFLNGSQMTASVGTASIYVKVERNEKTVKLTLDEYGIGVLAKEMDADAGMEALKAQAVLIRTSICKSIQEEGSETVLKKGYWTRSQMKSNWGASDYAEKYDRIQEAWNDTEGKILIYNGMPALTPYHKLSNGKIRSAAEVLGTEEYPYLQVKECPADVESEDAMTTQMIQGTDMEVTGTDSAGYVTEVRCGKETVKGEAFRDTYHLASACFTLQEFDGQIRVTSKGIGHGLGMSQYTAEQMAADGSSYQDILNYFFEGTTLEEVVEIVTSTDIS